MREARQGETWKWWGVNLWRWIWAEGGGGGGCIYLKLSGWTEWQQGRVQRPNNCWSSEAMKCIGLITESCGDKTKLNKHRLTGRRSAVINTVTARRFCVQIPARGPLYVESACSHCVCVGFLQILQLPPVPQRHLELGYVNSKLSVGVNVSLLCLNTLAPRPVDGVLHLPPNVDYSRLQLRHDPQNISSVDNEWQTRMAVNRAYTSAKATSPFKFNQAAANGTHSSTSVCKIWQILFPSRSIHYFLGNRGNCQI